MLGKYVGLNIREYVDFIDAKFNGFISFNVAYYIYHKNDFTCNNIRKIIISRLLQ